MNTHYPNFNAIADMEIIPTLFEYRLSDITDSNKTVSKQQAEAIMQFFATNPLFNWTNSNNSCEARADAICVLLEQWGIPHYKAWVFSGKYLHNHVG